MAEHSRSHNQEPACSSGGENQLLLDQIRYAYDQFEGKLAQLSILRELGGALLYINNFRRVCETILKVTINNTVARNCSIMLMDHERNRLFLVAATNPDGESYILDAENIFSKENVQYTFAPGQGVAGEALQNRASVLVEDVGASDVFARVEDTKVALGSLLSTPLIVEDQVLGVLSLSHPAKGVFQPETVNLFDIMASFVALAINSTLNYQRLQYSEEKYRALAEHALYGISIIQDGRHQYANPSYVVLSGYSLDELKKKPFSKLISPQVIAGEFTDATRHGPDAPRAYEAVMVTKTGDEIQVDISHVPFVYKGRPGEVVSVMDLSERKKLENQLRHAQKMEAIGTLAGGIAHDFNNILAAIMGYAELAQLDCPDDSPIAGNLTQVIKAGDRAKELVRQVLAFSRQEESQQRPLQVSVIVKEALKLLRASIPATIEIRQDIGNSTGKVMGDSTQIHQVLMNLCTNGAHAMQGKGGVLEVTLEDMDIDDHSVQKQGVPLKPGGYVRLSVSDSGHGMDQKTIKRIFDPFFTTKGPSVGTGMGLSVVHGIVKNHGGDIAVESIIDEGSKFDLFLPRIQDMATVEKKDCQPIASGTERILFVDDEEAIVQIGSQMLERLGYEVVARTSPIDALETFRAQPDTFDLVVTDQTMPQMTGESLAAELMRLKPNVPVVLCTGYSELLSEEKARAMGIRQYLMKPLVMRDLGKTIRKALNGN